MFTGERRVKSDLIFNALGNTDELSSHLGLAREFASKVEPTHPYVDQLLRIQCLLQGISFKIFIKYLAGPTFYQSGQMTLTNLNQTKSFTRDSSQLKKYIPI